MYQRLSRSHFATHHQMTGFQQVQVQGLLLFEHDGKAFDKVHHVLAAGAELLDDRVVVEDVLLHAFDSPTMIQRPEPLHRHTITVIAIERVLRIL